MRSYTRSGGAAISILPWPRRAVGMARVCHLGQRAPHCPDQDIDPVQPPLRRLTIHRNLPCPLSAHGSTGRKDTGSAPCRGFPPARAGRRGKSTLLLRRPSQQFTTFGRRVFRSYQSAGYLIVIETSGTAETMTTATSIAAKRT